VDLDDREVVSLPKLVGGPRYARPPKVGVAVTPRPPDPDELPLASERTPEEHALAQELGIDTSSLNPPAAHAANEGAGRALHSSGSWTAADGKIGAEARSGHRAHSLFRGRNGRSGAG
jgi:hypothetical protein